MPLNRFLLISRSSKMWFKEEKQWTEEGQQKTRENYRNTDRQTDGWTVRVVKYEQKA